MSTSSLNNASQANSEIEVTAAVAAPQVHFAEEAFTGGEGAFTQWVWVELIEGTETICPANTHQVHAEFI